ncbi:hypothetical protein A9Q90_06330 [Gammaproteobacteria bacterium 54_18_T64]|nr:hypothetical protein A9Q90_06330 [Gammaproteobacteria bacterium 54_18_T64]
MKASLLDLVNDFIEQHQLPKTFIDTIVEHYLPLAQWINQQRAPQRCYFIGISGAQGTGKSTLSALLKIILEHEYACNTATLSLDDLYLSSAEREKLSQKIHPLMKTRGVPGSHNVRRGLVLFDALNNLQEQQFLALPRFDKANDEAFPKAQWPAISGPVGVVLFEGWCVGASACTDEELVKPVNELEAIEDADGTWRRYINEQLETHYQQLFAPMERLIMLQAPDFASIRRWRWRQEEKLAAQGMSSQGSALMDRPTIERFIQHFERLTRQSLKQLPPGADILFELDSNQRIIRSHYAKP